MISLKSLFSRAPVKPALFIDAGHFEPCGEQKEEAWILFTHNEKDSIFDTISSALRSQMAVVVIDQESSDGTPYFAAEAGAVVILQKAGQSQEAALQEAMRVAQTMARRVHICQ